MRVTTTAEKIDTIIKFLNTGSDCHKDTAIRMLEDLKRPKNITGLIGNKILTNEQGISNIRN